MKLIDYDKYSKWAPGSVVVLLIVEALLTGFFLGVALMETALPHKSFGRMFLVLGFSSGVAVVQTALLALHNCRSSAETQVTEVAVH